MNPLFQHGALMFSNIWKNLNLFLVEFNWNSLFSFPSGDKSFRTHQKKSVSLLLQGLMDFHSTLDMGKFFGLAKNSLYSTLDLLTLPLVKKQFLRHNREQFEKAARLLKLCQGSSNKNYNQITLTVDDFVLEKEGTIGGLAKRCYSGESGTITNGITITTLCAVLGQGRATLVLDYSIFKPEDKRTKPMIALNMFRRIISWAKERQVYSDWFSGFDSAFVCKEMLDFCREVGLKACFTTKGTWNIIPTVADFPAEFMPNKLCLQQKLIEGMTWEKSCQVTGLEYFRMPAKHELFGDLMVLFFRQNGGETEIAITIDPNLKSTTIFRSSKFRWKQERYHWEFKQICLGDEIHNQTRERFEGMFLLRQLSWIFLCQLRKKWKMTPGEIKFIFKKERPRFAMLLGSEGGSQRIEVKTICTLKELLH